MPEHKKQLNLYVKCTKLFKIDKFQELYKENTKNKKMPDTFSDLWYNQITNTCIKSDKI